MVEHRSQEGYLPKWLLINQEMPVPYRQMHSICVALERNKQSSKRNAHGRVTHEIKQ